MRVVLAAAFFALVACGPRSADADPGTDGVSDVAGAMEPVAQITGLSGPEAVRYDPDRDVYYVSNFNGDGDTRDGNGFITRTNSDGEVLDLAFMVGTDVHPLHAPRGMNMEGGVLWVADVDGVHGFDPETGEHRAFHDLSGFSPGFLNDIGVNGSGTLYVTDTGLPRLYAITEGEATIAVEDSILGPANGITWDEPNGRFVLAPWYGVTDFATWVPGEDGGTLGTAGHIEAGLFDGIEPIQDGFLVATQSDSSLYYLHPTGFEQWLILPGRPADIAIDTRRQRVAVPYIDLNRVDIFDLPNRD
jgi:sugar lactone lactonase YvrE